jgi:hypothetical protein
MKFFIVAAVIGYGFTTVSSCSPVSVESDTDNQDSNYTNSQYSNYSDPPRVPSEREVKKERDQEAERYKQYQALLAKAPLYHSELRAELANNIATYRVSYRVSTDDFYGLTADFRCTHSPKMIKRAQAHGWELVKCSETAVIFFRKHNRKLVQCESVPTIPEIYDTLTLSIAHTSEDKLFLKNQRLDIIKMDKSGRPADGEIPFNHPYVVNFYNKPKSQDSSVIPIADQHFKDEIRFFDMRNVQVITLFARKGSNGCTKNPLGKMYFSNSFVELDSPSNSFFEMSSKLKQAAKYIK